MKIEKIHKKHLNEILHIAYEMYENERAHLMYLPPLTEMKESINDSISKMIASCEGLCLIEDDVMMAYILSYDVDNFFGKDKGAYIPLLGHGARNKELYNKLYTRISEHLISKGHTSHAITVYKHDAEAIDIFFWLGFGLRCIDSITEITKLPVVNNQIIIKKANVKNLDEIKALYDKYEHYFESSPMYMVRERESIEGLKNWLIQENKHLWIAYFNKKAVGFIRVEDDGETFISEHEKVMNITGAYVESNERKAGIATSLLIRLFSWLRENEYAMCGVDFESFNIDGAKFWNKHFAQYTYSVVRRIDERIL